MELACFLERGDFRPGWRERMHWGRSMLEMEAGRSFSSFQRRADSIYGCMGPDDWIGLTTESLVGGAVGWFGGAISIKSNLLSTCSINL